MSRKSKRQSAKHRVELCPGPVANRLGMRVKTVRTAMRAAGVTDPLTVQQVAQWRKHPGTAPRWFTDLLEQHARRQRAEELEREHRELLLRDRVERKLLTGQLPKKHSMKRHCSPISLSKR